MSGLFSLLSTSETPPAPQPEPIRLVIWDLDECLWQGTITEGGITYRQDVHDIVVALAKRGIVNAICSKNEMAVAQAVLEKHGLWPYFVFPSIDWTPKGPRLRALIEAIQLRPETALFIDDNAGNRAEAEHYVPGLRAVSDQAIPGLLDDKLLAGHDDPHLSRLHRYRLLQTRQAEAKQAGGDTTEFLRASRIQVTIEHDLEPHLDRVVELINRTNQLNFTKSRLPEDADAARAELRRILSPISSKAGLLRVRDRYGDYGFCGFYLVHHFHAHPAELRHFCFSCRILNMGVEAWMYRRLGKPRLNVVGDVLTDVAGDTRDIDWISLVESGHESGDDTGKTPDASAEPAADYYALLRGGCDAHTIAHYFALTVKDIATELHSARHGFEPTMSHSVMYRHALLGISAEAREAARPFGFIDSDFTSLAADPPPGRRGLWLLSFSHDSQTMLYRYKPTGELLPIRFYGWPHLHRSLIGADPAEVKVSPEVMAHLNENYEFVGPIPDEMFRDHMKMILDRAPPDARVFVLLNNEWLADNAGRAVHAGGSRHRNLLVREAVVPYANAEGVDFTWFFDPDGGRVLGDHYDRMVYYRLYLYLKARMAGEVAART